MSLMKGERIPMTIGLKTVIDHCSNEPGFIVERSRIIVDAAEAASAAYPHECKRFEGPNLMGYGCEGCDWHERLILEGDGIA